MSEVTGMFSLTVPAVMSFPHLLEPAKFKRNGREQGEAKYGASFLFAIDPAHPDTAGIKSKVLEVAKAKWPGRDVAGDYKAGKLKLPFTSGDKLCDKRVAKLKAAGKDDDHKGDFQKGHLVLKAASKYAPNLAVIANGKIVDLDGSNKEAFKGQFYFGVKALALFNFVAYDAIKDGENDGVTAYLQSVLSTNKGDRLSGGASAAETFKGYVGQISAEDPTAGSEELSDDISF